MCSGPNKNEYFPISKNSLEYPNLQFKPSVEFFTYSGGKVTKSFYSLSHPSSRTAQKRHQKMVYFTAIFYQKKTVKKKIVFYPNFYIFPSALPLTAMLNPPA